jgi:hypothetical protein
VKISHIKGEGKRADSLSFDKDFKTMFGAMREAEEMCIMGSSRAYIPSDINLLGRSNKGV